MGVSNPDIANTITKWYFTGIMRPTEEQSAILHAKHRVIRVNARAGTGKTTTLNMLARKKSDQKMVYLVFNRRAKEAADAVFPDNVKTYTLHAMAFRHEGRKWKDAIGNFSPSDLLFAFPSDAQVLASLTHSFLTYFLNSPYNRLEDAVDPFYGYLTEGQAARFKHDVKRIVLAARDIAVAWNRKEKPCPHDFYLKLFHKSEAFHRTLNQYDTVLVDEGQDLSPIMLDALEKCRKRIVVVGDTHQQIYSFRYATDAMRKLRCDAEFDLTRSFRFGKTIADLAGMFIREAKDDQNFHIRGNPEKRSRVRTYGYLGDVAKPGTAILSRTNVALFSNAMRLKEQGRQFCFERDIQPVLWRALDVFRLFDEDKERIKDSFIASFEDMAALKKYAEEMEDFPLQGICQIVQKYAHAFPGAVFEMAELCVNKTSNENAVVLSTIHSAKGHQYETVRMDPDTAAAFDPDLFHKIRDDEINLAYVGFTRAIKNLYLPDDFLTLLTPRWQSFLEQCKAAPIKKTGPRKKKKKTGQPPEKTKKQEQTHVKIIRHATKPPETVGNQVMFHYKVGDRVQTPNGPGTIIKIDGSQGLVDLENQIANVWCELFSMK